MITKQPLTGYTNSVGNIMYTWVWHEIFKTKAPMRFLPGDYSDIVDVWIQTDNCIALGMYPFTAPSVEDFAKAHEAELWAILTQTNQMIVTLRISKDKIAPLMASEFVDYFPYYSVKDEMFLFNTSEDKGGFPAVYFMPKSSRNGANLNTLDVLAHASHEIYNPAGEDTLEGKQFAYMLIQSRVVGRFEPEIPQVKDIHFPSNGRDAVPTNLNLEALEKFITNNKIDQIPAKPSKETALLLPAKVEVEEEINGEDFDDVPSDPEVEDSIVAEILTKGTVNLSDVIEIGVSKILKMIGDTDFVIDIVLDIPEAAKRMAIWMNTIWIIPNDDSFDPEESFGESEQYFVTCTESNFPKNAVAG